MKRRTTVILSAGISVLILCVIAVLLKLLPGIRQSLCHHDTWENGTCVSCGLACRHESWLAGKCEICGQLCDHCWENGNCSICGQSCAHADYKDGICVICGYVCAHDYCDGRCFYCSAECVHKWENGACLICGIRCGHDSHDSVTRKCTVCGLETPHHYRNGRCKCGAEPFFEDGLLSPEFYEESEHPGTVEKLEYIQKLYYQGGTEVSKKINIYLPYGYTEENQYNVLVLIHGGWDNEDSWISKEYDFGYPLVMKNIYDRMIEQKLCDPLIIVCPTTYNGPDCTNDSGTEHMAIELRETILPYIAEHYSTYAASGKITDLQAAREHFGIGGMSNGALYALNSGMRMNLDLFSNFICFSGNSEPYSVVEAINSAEWKNLPISLFFAGAGFYDSQWQNTYYGFQIIVENTERLTEGENAFYKDIAGGHDFAVWHVNMFNALQIAFP